MTPTTFKTALWCGYIGCGYAGMLWFIQSDLWHVTNKLYGRFPLAQSMRMLRYTARTVHAYYLYGPLAALLPVAGWYLYNRTVFPWSTIAAVLLYQAYIWAYQSTPPSVLLLGTSRPESIDLRERLERMLHPYRVVVLFDSSVVAPLSRTDFQRNLLEWDNLRTSGRSDWRTIVHPLMDSAPVLVVDTRIASPAVVEETTRILGRHDLVAKTLFLTEPSGDSSSMEAGSHRTGSASETRVTEGELRAALKNRGLTNTKSPDEAVGRSYE